MNALEHAVESDQLAVLAASASNSDRAVQLAQLSSTHALASIALSLVSLARVTEAVYDREGLSARAPNRGR